MRTINKILVTGASGFVGQAVLEELDRSRTPMVGYLRAASDPVVACRVGARIVRGDITDRAALSAAFARGVDAVVHLVGILREEDESFEQIHVQGTKNVVELAQQFAVAKLVHVSALGASETGSTRYQRTKGQAEQIVRNSGVPWTILRPSAIFGAGSEMVAVLEFLASFFWRTPVPDTGSGKLQPIYVRDVAKCVTRALVDEATARQSYDLGGPEVLTFDQMASLVEARRGWTKPHLTVPYGLLWLYSCILNLPGLRTIARWAQSKVLFFPLATSGELSLLAESNTCDGSVPTVFGVTPVPMAEWLKTPEYSLLPWPVWRARTVDPIPGPGR
jgi:NADH dehydrogenase